MALSRRSPRCLRRLERRISKHGGVPQLVPVDLVGTLNGVVKFALGVVLLFVVLVAIGMTRGDGLPGKMVLTMDLRGSMQDSAQSDGSCWASAR